MLLPFAFAAPRFLTPLLPKSTEAEIVLMQILVPTLFALIGALITLALVVRAYHNQGKRHAQELEKQRQHFESLSTAAKEKKKQDFFNEPIKYDHRGIV